MLAANEWDFLAAVHGPDRDFATIDIPLQNPVVEGERAEGLEEALRGTVELVGVGHLADTANDNLRRKPRLDTLNGILRAVKRILSERLVLPRPGANAITNGVRGLQRSLESVRLFRGRNQLNLRDKFQCIDIIPVIAQGCQCLSIAVGQFLPSLKGLCRGHAGKGYPCRLPRKAFR